jgi:hypothetical protein
LAFYLSFLVLLLASFQLPVAIFPEFKGVDDVLPQHVTAGSNGGNGVEIHISHPDA